MIETFALTKQYDPARPPALDQLNLRVQPGEIFCLLGQNGAGKTTTINLLLGFLPPTSGRALINGISVAESPQETRQHVAYLPETVMLYPNLTGLENLAFFSRLAGFRHASSTLHELLTRAGLPAEAHGRRVGTYSKGMRQKVGIAIALAKQAKALLLDEPTSGLDPKASNEFSALLTTLSQDGTAILMATHDIFRAREVGTHIGIMWQGQLMQTLATPQVTAQELESLYLQTVSS
ncbi:ABC-2 type transport system ATP-binding protein [Catalinimonas alkaloidigena]|uniref:ABC-2 type transport system ATP-binding protein n=1 Tax=Catalinimonas alkaloidigena TaxID=1075417 RepID=A0A1G9VE07_9BACT|nr:ABC transporter ATP-binding protein [Catalinimonas alkaloidigena]SDM70277.1 ABC-2 type transport system ATP-binding protein [Catalinimonas alkaloidigena]